MESVFEKAKPILERKPEPAYLVQALELPADLKTRIAAMPDPEERIRAIVEYVVYKNAIEPSPLDHSKLEWSARLQEN